MKREGLPDIESSRLTSTCFRITLYRLQL